MNAHTLRTDGGSRGNPGPAAAAFVLQGPDGGTLARAGRFLGEATNNVAEYQALVMGLDAALAAGVRRIRVLADSELVVRQVNGAYKVKHENMKPLYRRVMTQLAAFEHWTIGHVRRESNAEADALVNEALDGRRDVGDPPPVSGTGPGAQASLF